MDIKEVKEVVSEGYGKVANELKNEFAAIDKKHADAVAQLNDDAKKTGETVGELKAKVDELIAKNGKLKAELQSESFGADRQKALKVSVMDMVSSNYESIKNLKPFMEEKVMTMGVNLTGTSQISYVDNPILRSYFNPHLYDVFRIIPTATGNVTFPRASSPISTGSFGPQTEGNAKNSVDYNVSMINTSVGFIAGYTKVSRQMLQDLPFLQGYLSSSLVEDWNRQFNNTAMATITASATAGSTSETVVAARIVDYVAQHNALGLGTANLILTTNAVWASVLKTLPTNGSYSIPGGITIGANGETRIMGVPLVPHAQLPTGRIYVMNTDAFSIAQASGLALRSTEFDSDDFQKNLVTYRMEARVALLSFQPTAAVYGSAS